MSYQIRYEDLEKSLSKIGINGIDINSNSIKVDDYINDIYSPSSFNMYDDIKIIELYY